MFSDKIVSLGTIWKGEVGGCEEAYWHKTALKEVELGLLHLMLLNTADLVDPSACLSFTHRNWG